MEKIICRTNLDLWNEEWPTELPRIPIVGEIIESKTIHGDFRLSLKVVAIRWKFFSISGNAGVYVPEIELHDYRQRSITEFYEWYAPLVGKSVQYFI